MPNLEQRIISLPKIKHTLKQRHITHQKIAEVLKIGRSTLTLKLNGKRSLSIKQLNTLIAYYQLSWDDISEISK
ncbi:MAG: helix-turn-helix domain-containing protein [Lactobacillus sp.]|nr:helix-turn-helix domain-containing protein [Lactobacillus sp.]